MLSTVFTLFLAVMTLNYAEGRKTARCQKWRYHYLDMSLEGKTECKPCAICKPGFKQVTHCTKVDNTHCVPCRRDTYSSANTKRCRPCKHCRQGGKFRQKCTNIEKAQCECQEENTYYKRGKCIPCSKCPPGKYMTSHCTLTRDIQCKKCQEGTYFTKENDLNYCVQCTHCRSGELVIHTCNSTHDTVCGECIPGMFRLLSSYQCVPCSPCYPDVNGSYDNAIIIDECRRRNPDQSRLCMPTVTTLPYYVSNITEDIESIVSDTEDMIVSKTHAQARFFEGDNAGFALFITTCILIIIVCIVLLSLLLAYCHRKTINVINCDNFCVKKHTTKQRKHTSRNLLDEYLITQISSQSQYCLNRSNSANITSKKTISHQSNATTVSLDTGKYNYFTESKFDQPCRWTIGTGNPSMSSFSEIFSVSATGTLSSNKGDNNSRSGKKY